MPDLADRQPLGELPIMINCDRRGLEEPDKKAHGLLHAQETLAKSRLILPLRELPGSRE